ncbi:hypothetical protein JMJ35_009800 [Cladonia borealis]|uniref:Uncharacterized protein n=1 Tax=Cladonia borealis TaxID=184061 RepID=A0AA39U500_9LECA|nr:hypothetical protein JMJ35_009800 [Cladonia borealis]
MPSLSTVQYEDSSINNEIRNFKVGIRFEHIGSDSSALDPTATKESFIKKKHWCLVFTPQTLNPSSCSRVELKRAGKGLAFVATSVLGELAAHPLGVWAGCVQDIKELMDDHPMNKSFAKYSAWHNNCQHWVATLLVLLEAQCVKKPNRSFHIQYRKRYRKVLSALAETGVLLYNKPNPLFQGATNSSMPAGVAAAGLLGMAATAATTVAIELPAAGLMGLLGATETFVIGTTATAGATAAMIALPIVGAGVIVGGVVLLIDHLEWKDKTMFRDPRCR